MNDLIKRLRHEPVRYNGAVKIVNRRTPLEIEAADRLTAMKAAGDGLGPFVEHQLECRMGMRLGRQYCTCGLSDKLKQWKEASDV